MRSNVSVNVGVVQRLRTGWSFPSRHLRMITGLDWATFPVRSGSSQADPTHAQPPSTEVPSDTCLSLTQADRKFTENGKVSHSPRPLGAMSVARRESDALSDVVIQQKCRWVGCVHRKDDWGECVNQISEGTAWQLGSRTRPGSG